MRPGISLQMYPTLLVNWEVLDMSNPMKYIKDLEAVGFQRNQAEAQVQMVLDALEGDLVTKSDFNNLLERIDHRFKDVDHRFTQMQQYIDMQIKDVRGEIKESEFRIVTRLGFLMVSTVSVAVAVLTWLIKV